MIGTKLAMATFMLVGALAQARATDLALDCSVIQSNPNGSEASLNIRYEIDFATATVREYHDVGFGYALFRTHNFVKADDAELVFFDDGTRLETIDRRTGVLYYRNRSDGVVQRGTCISKSPQT